MTISTLNQKLQKAFTERDYSILSWLELCQLVELKWLHPKTAERLGREFRVGVHSGSGV